jgi:hypothetical protein
MAWLDYSQWSDCAVSISSSIKNNKIPIKMTDVVKNKATRGHHGPLYDQRSKGRKGKDGVECFFHKK